MNVVDSSGWLEYFADTDHADQYEPAILATAELIVPVVCLYEVYKIVCRQRDEGAALVAVAEMQEGTVVEINPSLALEGTQLSLQYRIPMADSLILAVALRYNATLWTQDADFKGVPGVRYFERQTIG